MSRYPKLGNVISHRSRSTPGGRGICSSASVAPQPVASSICSSDPATPGIEMSRAAWTRSRSATSTSASPSSRSDSGARSRSELKYVVPSVYLPSRLNAASSTSPGRALEPSSGRLATPVQDADNAGGCPSVRCPPTTSTPSSAAAHAIPSSTVSASSRSGLTSMSTRPSGRAPIALMSDTLVITAAAPAACGLACTNVGTIASPHTIRYSSPCGIAAASSPSIAAASLRTIDSSRLACIAGALRIISASSVTDVIGGRLE